MAQSEPLNQHGSIHQRMKINRPGLQPCFAQQEEQEQEEQERLAPLSLPIDDWICDIVPFLVDLSLCGAGPRLYFSQLLLNLMNGAIGDK